MILSFLTVFLGFFCFIISVLEMFFELGMLGYVVKWEFVFGRISRVVRCGREGSI